ncbi:hypothetical protein QR680_010361 [Steinernema hermaphroditum]|uniref:Uncharacterized protein n=1 Tax=Steinernema hermaphroditum TaxID=289476 RepID=A0AA39IRD4_9BILA|nr:hypothetical protein QR680_010361 [Steinernema hermaphroditum]
MIRNKKGKLESDLYDQILHYLHNGNQETFFLAHSWTSSPATTRQPTFCIPEQGCVLLVFQHNLGGYDVKSDRNTDHGKFAVQVPIVNYDASNEDPQTAATENNEDNEKEEKEPVVYMSGSNNIDKQAMRGWLSTGLADKGLNEIFRCSMFYVDFHSNAHLIGQIKEYFSEKHIGIFNSICAGCPPTSPCLQSFGRPGYTIEKMIEDTERIRYGYYSPIKKSKHYPPGVSMSASASAEA